MKPGLMMATLLVAGVALYFSTYGGENLIVDDDMTVEDAAVVEAPVEKPVEVIIEPKKEAPAAPAVMNNLTPLPGPKKKPTASEALDKAVKAETEAPAYTQWAKKASTFFVGAKQAVMESPARYLLAVPARWWHVSCVIVGYTFHRVSKARGSTIMV